MIRLGINHKHHGRGALRRATPVRTFRDTSCNYLGLARLAALGGDKLAAILCSPRAQQTGHGASLRLRRLSVQSQLAVKTLTRGKQKSLPQL
jgi:hypothetical protein